jgi:hypothetical protein
MQLADVILLALESKSPPIEERDWVMQFANVMRLALESKSCLQVRRDIG